jgi:hypothetical protein
MVCYETPRPTTFGRPDWLRLAAATLLAAGLSAAWSLLGWAQQPAFIQSFQSQGPAPVFGPAADVQSGDAIPNATTSGAIQAVLPDPNNANRLFIGSVNGGVWSTTNGGTTWRPLTDNQASLSIASLAFNSTNSQQIYAGVGLVSNGMFGNKDPAGRGGARTGLLWSNDGGTTWQPLGGTDSRLVFSHFQAIDPISLACLSAAQTVASSFSTPTMDSERQHERDTIIRVQQRHDRNREHRLKRQRKG